MEKYSVRQETGLRSLEFSGRVRDRYRGEAESRWEGG